MMKQKSSAIAAPKLVPLCPNPFRNLCERAQGKFAPHVHHWDSVSVYERGNQSGSGGPHCALFANVGVASSPVHQKMNLQCFAARLRIYNTSCQRCASGSMLNVGMPVRVLPLEIFQNRAPS